MINKEELEAIHNREFPDKWIYVYEQHAAGRTYVDISAEFGVTPSRIREICLKLERFLHALKGGNTRDPVFFPLSTLAYNILYHLDLLNFERLSLISKAELGDYRGSGKGIVAEVEALMAKHGYKLAEHPSDPYWVPQKTGCYNQDEHEKILRKRTLKKLREMEMKTKIQTLQNEPLNHDLHDEIHMVYGTKGRKLPMINEILKFWKDRYTGEICVHYEPDDKTLLIVAGKTCGECWTKLITAYEKWGQEKYHTKGKK